MLNNALIYSYIITRGIISADKVTIMVYKNVTWYVKFTKLTRSIDL